MQRLASRCTGHSIPSTGRLYPESGRRLGGIPWPRSRRRRLAATTVATAAKLATVATLARMAMARMATAATAATVEGATWSCTAVFVQQRFVLTTQSPPTFVVCERWRAQISRALSVIKDKDNTRKKISHRTLCTQRPCSKCQTSKKQSRNMQNVGGSLGSMQRVRHTARRRCTSTHPVRFTETGPKRAGVDI